MGAVTREVVRAMLGLMFSKYLLRTTDVEAARRFYAEAIGLALPLQGPSASALEVWPLHEDARARGVPAHWLGQIAVDDVDGTAERLRALGSERLGKTMHFEDGTAFATLRDPLGAVVSLRARAAAPRDRPVEWCQLHTRDADRAWELYSGLFGWAAKETIEVPGIGTQQLFAWTHAGDAVGSMGSTALTPGVHPHWLFFFSAADAEAAITRVRALGGTAQDPVRLPDGSAFAGCEDPQGAAFGLVRRGK